MQSKKRTGQISKLTFCCIKSKITNERIELHLQIIRRALPSNDRSPNTIKVFSVNENKFNKGKKM